MFVIKPSMPNKFNEYLQLDISKEHVKKSYILFVAWLGLMHTGVMIYWYLYVYACKGKILSHEDIAYLYVFMCIYLFNSSPFISSFQFTKFCQCKCV